MEFPPSRQILTTSKTEPNSKPDVAELLGIRIQNLKITGNNKTKSDIIEKILTPMNRGTLMSFKEFEKTKEETERKLEALGVFSEANFVIDVSKTAVKEERGPINFDIQLQLTELKMKEPLSLKTNISPGENPQFVVKTGLKNVFGRCENFTFSVGSDSPKDMKDFHASFYKPFLLWEKPGQSLLLNLDRHKIDHEYTSSYSEKDLNFGIIFDQGGKVGSNTTRKWSYELAHRSIDCNKTANEKILVEGGPHVKSSISHFWEYDTRDNALLPTRGSAVQLGTELAGLGGDVFHIKQTSNLSTTFPLGSNITLSLGLRTGMHFPLFYRSYISDRFFLGGVDTFRGFEMKSIGPRAVSKCENKPVCANYLGGDMFYVSSANINIPIVTSPMGDLKLHMFSQFGNIVSYQQGYSLRQHWNEISDFDKVRVVLGSGIMWEVAGMARIEINFNCPLKYQKTDSFVHGLQFGIGGELF